MDKIPKLIVMLTHHDRTVKNAYELFEQCKSSKAEIWGCKETPLSLPEMKKLYTYMKQCGKTTALEIVAYTEKQCVEGAKKATECGCDLLMGTKYFHSVGKICSEHGIKYLPFVGDVSGRPSVLQGRIDDMIAEAKVNLQKGAFGVDLLGYRYTGDALKLNREVTSRVRGPICIAGSIDSYQKLDEIIDVQADMFTIGSAFFEHRFGDDFCRQIDAVCDYVKSRADKKRSL